jgi:DNA-binding MarR family transcriptional regulator
MIDENDKHDYSRSDDIGRLGEAYLRVLIGIRNDRLWVWSDALEEFTTLDLHVLLMVERKPDLILKEVRDRLELPNSTLTSVVDRLEKRGVVERTINRRDHRSYGLRLTEYGHEVRAEHERVLHLMMERVLDCLPETEKRHEFVELMARIGDCLEHRTATELGLAPRRPLSRTRRHKGV